MKQLFFLVMCGACCAASQAQQLFTLGTQKVSTQEFLNAYNKNKSILVDNKSSVTDYLELYTRFKLKVKAAYDMRLDTLPQLNSDLQSYKSQLEESYVNDEKGVESLTEEAFDRLQKNYHVTFYHAPFSNAALDTIGPYTAIKEVENKLKTGFAETTFRSANGITCKIADVGYLTALTLPYEFENAIYNTPKGSFSKITRGKKGYYIFKVQDIRADIGRWKIAQILLAFGPNENANNTPALKKLADSLRSATIKGADFAELAKQFSNDKLSLGSGGEVMPFGSGKYKPEFETELLKLKSKGDISEVIVTAFGYHVVKLLDRTFMPTQKEKESSYWNDLKLKVTQDSRLLTVKDRMAKTIMNKLAYKRNSLISSADISMLVDSLVKNPLKSSGSFPKSKQALFTLKGKSFTLSNFADFIKEYKLSGELYQGESNEVLVTKFIETSTITYYRQNLSKFSDAFNAQVEEFKEGNMLFEAMERNVWSKASADIAGLKNHYINNAQKYKWTVSATAVIYNCGTIKAASTAREAVLMGKDIAYVTGLSEGLVQADSGRYEVTQITLKEGEQLVKGQTTNLLINNLDSTASFVKVIGLHPDGEQRSFEDSKGLVINDFQNVVEEAWINSLKKKYPVKLNSVEWAKILKQ